MRDAGAVSQWEKQQSLSAFLLLPVWENGLESPCSWGICGA